MAFCKTRVALAALSVALLAACGDSGPSQFNAAAMNDDLSLLQDSPSDDGVGQVFDAMNAVLGSSSTLSIGKLAAGPLSARDAHTATLVLKSALARPAISASAGIPAEDAGKTWVYNSGSQTYEVSDLTGAPANGVRVLLYEQDINGQFILPLVETGHVDLTDLSSGSTRKGRLQAVTGSTTMVDYTVTVTGDDTNGDIGVNGYLVFPAGRLNVDFSATGSTSGSTTTFDLNSSLDFPSRDLSFDFSFSGSSDDAAQTGAYSLTETVNSRNGRMDLVATSDYNDNTSGTIKVNGDIWATFAGDTLTPVDGRTLTGDEHDALEGVIGLTYLGIIVPLAMVMVMAALTGTLPPTGI
jgi:hypothetical protein